MPKPTLPPTGGPRQLCPDLEEARRAIRTNLRAERLQALQMARVNEYLRQLGKVMKQEQARERAARLALLEGPVAPQIARGEHA